MERRQSLERLQLTIQVFKLFLFYFICFLLPQQFLVSSLGSKRGAAAATTVAASGFPGTNKAGPVQVIFNGKIVTPQSLIPKKSGHHHDAGKKSRPPLMKPQTIDETAPESADRVSMQPLGSKLGLKK